MWPQLLAALLARLGSAGGLPLPGGRLPTSWAGWSRFLTRLGGSRRQRARRFASGLGQFAQGIGDLASNQRIGGIASGASRAAGGIGIAIGAAVGGPAGAAVGAVSAIVGKFGEVLGDSVEGLRKWSDELNKANLVFAEFSPAMARVQAEQERRAVILGRERGERRAVSARYLSESIGKFNRAIAPYEDMVARLQNILAGLIVRGMTAGLVPLIAANATNILLLKKLLAFFETNLGKPGHLDVDDYFKQFGIPTPPEYQKRPPRFRPPPMP